MRFIDAIIDAVNQNPNLSAVEKAVLVERIERLPQPDELQRARDTVYNDNGTCWVEDSPVADDGDRPGPPQPVK